MANTPNQALPYPSLGDSANGPAAFQALATAVEKQLVMTFASATERSTKLTAPVEGTVAYLRDTDTLTLYTGSAWRLLQYDLGQWVDCAAAMKIVDGTSNTAAAGSSISLARYMKIGNTVWLKGYGSTGTAALTTCSLILPNSVVGTPYWRDFNIGDMNISGTGAPSTQFGTILYTDLARVVSVTITNAYNGAAAGNSVRWNLVYEVA